MQKLLPFFLFLLPLLAVAQPAVDGNLSDPDYVTIATKQNTNAGFGPNTDVSSILAYSDPVNNVVYVGVTGNLDVGTNNGIGLWLNFSTLNGAAAGTPLGFDGAGHYMDGESGGTNDDFTADFEVDYMFAVNPGNGSSSVFVDAASNVGGQSAAYLGATDQSGGQGSSSVAATGFATTYAFNNGGGANQGFELAIDLTSVGDIPPGATLEAFAFVVSETGFFSDVTVPGNITTAAPGFNADFNALGGGPYHSGLFQLPIELGEFTAVPNAKGNEINLNWTTLTEDGSSYIAVERSAEEGDFAEIGRLTAAGSSTFDRTYDWTDSAPLPGRNVYRLRMVDLDGTTDFSSLRVVDLVPTADVAVFPNPVSEWLTVRVSGDRPVTAYLYDTYGREVTRRNLTAGTAELPTIGLPAGVYLLRLTDDTEPREVHQRLVRKY